MELTVEPMDPIKEEKDAIARRITQIA